MEEFEWFILITFYIHGTNILALKRIRVKEIPLLYLIFSLIIGAFGLKYLEVPFYPFYQLSFIFMAIAMNYPYILYYRERRQRDEI